jgi:putative transcriptional regulator
MAKSLAYRRIKAGLDDAAAYLDGDLSRGIEHTIDVPSVDVVALRRRTKLSQAKFALSIGVSVETLRNWEQGKRSPKGPARVLLALLDRDPGIVNARLGGAA